MLRSEGFDFVHQLRGFSSRAGWLCPTAGAGSVFVEVLAGETRRSMAVAGLGWREAGFRRPVYVRPSEKSGGSGFGQGYAGLPHVFAAAVFI